MDNTKTNESENKIDTDDTQEDKIEDVVKETTINYQDKFLRISAEIENLRKRFSKEKEEAIKFSLQKFAKDILKVADQLKLALDNSDNTSFTKESFIEGIQMTSKELHNIFASYGITKIDSYGKEFNAHYHQAISEENESALPPQTISKVLQDGYFLHDRLIRPALVIVKK